MGVGTVGESGERGAPLATRSTRNLLYEPPGFPLGSRQEMSLAREEVIETVRDYKTSKQHWGGGASGERQRGVTAVASIVWERSRRDLNNQAPAELHPWPTPPHTPHTSVREESATPGTFFVCRQFIFPLIFLSGFEGHNCENNVDDCPGHKCMNGGICVDGVNTYNCQCPPEWTGTSQTFVHMLLMEVSVVPEG